MSVKDLGFPIPSVRQRSGVSEEHRMGMEHLEIGTALLSTDTIDSGKSLVGRVASGFTPGIARNLNLYTLPEEKGNSAENLDPTQTMQFSSDESRCATPLFGITSGWHSVAEFHKLMGDLKISFFAGDYKAAREIFCRILALPFKCIGGWASLFCFTSKAVDILATYKLINIRIISEATAHAIEKVLKTYIYPIAGIGCIFGALGEYYSLKREVTLLNGELMQVIKKFNEKKFEDTSNESLKSELLINERKALLNILYALKNNYVPETPIAKIQGKLRDARTKLKAAKAEVKELKKSKKNDLQKRKEEAIKLEELQQKIKGFDESENALVKQLQAAACKKSSFSAEFGDDAFKDLMDSDEDNTKSLTKLIQRVEKGDLEGICEAKRLCKDLPIQAYKRISGFALGFLAAVTTAVAVLFFPITSVASLVLLGVGLFFEVMKRGVAKEWFHTRGWGLADIDMRSWWNSVQHYFVRKSENAQKCPLGSRIRGYFF